MSLITRFSAWRAQRRKAAAQADAQRYSKVPPVVEYSKPDRTPEEVDAIMLAARRARVAAQRAEVRSNSQHKDYTTDRVNAEGHAWLPRQEWVASIDDPSIPDYGTWARFEYVDADGVVTRRHIRQWSKHGAYIEGFCMERREGRLFRQDRISLWRCG